MGVLVLVGRGVGEEIRVGVLTGVTAGVAESPPGAGVPVGLRVGREVGFLVGRRGHHQEPLVFRGRGLSVVGRGRDF
ncbi:hypothetical protein AB0K16_40115 [Nonomuraea jabiensis]|uniref:hypothetical protein n=1 Tax=Nonomuraea jabiensis TaxID=882448 RepID=UPI0034370098